MRCSRAAPALIGSDNGVYVNHTGGWWAPVSGLPDHLVCLEQDDRGNGEAESLGRLQIDD